MPPKSAPLKQYMHIAWLVDGTKSAIYVECCHAYEQMTVFRFRIRPARLFEMFASKRDI